MAQDTIPFFNTCFSYPQIHKLVYRPYDSYVDILEADYDSAFLTHSRCFKHIWWHNDEDYLHILPPSSTIFGIAHTLIQPWMPNGTTISLSTYSPSAGLTPLISLNEGKYLNHKQFYYELNDTIVKCYVYLFDRAIQASDSIYVDHEATDDFFHTPTDYLIYMLMTNNNFDHIYYFTECVPNPSSASPSLNHYWYWGGFFPILELPCPAPKRVSMRYDSLRQETFSWYPGADTTLFQLAFYDEEGSLVFETDTLTDTTFTLTDSMLNAYGFTESGLMSVRLRKGCSYMKSPYHTVAWSEYSPLRRFYHTFHVEGITISDESPSAQFHLMPNPARRSVVLECSNNAGNTPVTLKVCDMAGHEILVHKFQDTHLELDISAWPRGVYLLSLSSTAGVTVQKLVVE